MKLATFRVHTPVGPFERFGIVRLDGGPEDRATRARQSQGWIIDVNFAFAAKSAEGGVGNPNRRADAFCPADLQTYAELHGSALDGLDELVQWFEARSAATAPDEIVGPRTERVAYRLDEVELRPPIARAPVLRDFAAFENHLQTTFRKMGLEIPPEWYERPTAFKGNSTTLVGHDEEVRWPRYTRKLDYELELAAVIGAPGQDIDVEAASGHILGYTLLNDFSARDTQKGEMAMSTGPYKGKDFAWALGPWIVTPDELGEIGSLAMSVRINGDVWAESTPGAMQWTFPEIISYTSQDEPLNVGDVFGSGTVNQGCGFEIDRWIAPGDVVELEAAGIGVLRNRISEAAGPEIRWRRDQSE